MATTATKLSQENIKNAKAAVTAYQNRTEELHKNLQTIVTNLRAANFVGDASAGYQVCFDNIMNSLNTEIKKLDDMLDTILSTVNQLLTSVDPKLKTQNESLTAQDAAN